MSGLSERESSRGTAGGCGLAAHVLRLQAFSQYYSVEVTSEG